ncbi:MAG: carbohydrate ABC transporter permease [Oscillospiraceae bacterium]|nr:carbohydrate ABC transporter permease [Oscillospiraceae bacterium]
MKSLSRKPSRSLGGDIGIILFLCALGAFMILPFIYTIVQSIKPLEELFIYPPRFFWVNAPTLDNFFRMGQLASNLWVPFGRYLFNSVFVTFAGTFFHVVTASMAAYALAKNRFPGRKLLSNTIQWALLFVGPITAIPQYVLMAVTGMIDTYWALILPSIGTPMGLFLIQQNMYVVPDALMEAARIDGAGNFKIYWSIVLPMVKPALLTAMIFAFQGLWNGANSGFIYSEELKVLPTILSQIASSGIQYAGVGSAVSVVLLIPPVVVFLLTQSNIMETMAQSGIK